MDEITVQKRRRVLVGMAWLSPQQLPRYKFFKIWQTGFGGYAVEPVSKIEPVEVNGRTIGKEAAAWQWIETTCPWPWSGVWYCDHPGLVWAKTVQAIGRKGKPAHLVDVEMLKSAFAVAGRAHGAWGSLPSPEIVENEAVAYTPFLYGEHKRHAHHDVDKRHPHIIPTRTCRDYARLRRKYNVPDGRALDYMPESLIRETWGRRKSYAAMLAQYERCVTEESDRA